MCFQTLNNIQAMNSRCVNFERKRRQMTIVSVTASASMALPESWHGAQQSHRAGGQRSKFEKMEALKIYGAK